MSRPFLPQGFINVLTELFSLDDHIQTYLRKAMRQTFASSTVVCVTHHLEFVLDFDTVVVMSSGEIAERGNPRDLLATPSSLFATLYGAQITRVDEATV